MSYTLQLKRYTTTAMASQTGAAGELFVDLTKNVVVVNDGTTAGGWPMQSALTSGTTIKTVNSTSLLGSGDLPVQATLVSGTNIKTVNGTTLLGSGDVPLGLSYTTGTTTVTGNLSIAGNLTVSGTQTTVNVETVLTTETANVIQVSYLQGNSSVNSGNITVSGNVVIPAGNVIASRLVTTNGLFWSNGTAFSSGSTYGNTQVASYLPTYSGNIAAVTVPGAVTAGNIITTNGIFWANGLAFGSNASSSGSSTALASTNVQINGVGSSPYQFVMPSGYTSGTTSGLAYLLDRTSTSAAPYYIQDMHTGGEPWTNVSSYFSGLSTGSVWVTNTASGGSYENNFGNNNGGSFDLWTVYQWVQDSSTMNYTNGSWTFTQMSWTIAGTGSDIYSNTGQLNTTNGSYTNIYLYGYVTFTDFASANLTVPSGMKIYIDTYNRAWFQGPANVWAGFGATVLTYTGSSSGSATGFIISVAH